MAKEAVFTMKLEPELRDEFMAAAAAEDRPASQVARELMRDYVERRRRMQAYDAFLERKVDVARADKRAGRVHTNEAVEAEFAGKRAELRRKAGM
ncbi:MAG: antitoxin of toxin-antitoxin stability system [Pseudomonadota bacterium]